MSTSSDTPRTTIALELSRDKYELAARMGRLERELDTANEQLAALREEQEVLRSQVENADVNLAQVRLNTKADRDRLAAELKEAVSALNSLGWEKYGFGWGITISDTPSATPHAGQDFKP